MKKQNNGGPAFPVAFRMNDKQVILEDGISVRDYFAGKALQGICASSPSDDCTDEYIAAESYRLADAMIKARETKK